MINRNCEECHEGKKSKEDCLSAHAVGLYVTITLGPGNPLLTKKK